MVSGPAHRVQRRVSLGRGHPDQRLDHRERLLRRMSGLFRAADEAEVGGASSTDGGPGMKRILPSRHRPIWSSFRKCSG